MRPGDRADRSPAWGSRFRARRRYAEHPEAERARARYQAQRDKGDGARSRPGGRLMTARQRERAERPLGCAAFPGRRTMFGAGRCPPRGSDLEFTPLCSSVRLRAPPATRGVLCVSSRASVRGLRQRCRVSSGGARLTGSVSLA